MRVTRVLLASLFPLVLLGCSNTGVPLPQTLMETSPPAPGMDASLRDPALDLVKAREAALQQGDRKAFLATIDPSAAEFARTQARWFDNLGELPTTDLALSLGNEEMMTRVHGEGDLQLPIEFTMRLQGFDAHAVTQALIYTFVRDGDDVFLSSDRNTQSDALTGWLPAPWDLTDIEVRSSPTALAVFDHDTVGDADEVMAALDEAAEIVKARVPRWSGRYVAYDISDVQAIDALSTMDVDETAGVAFFLLDGKGEVAASRFIVNPRHVGDPTSRAIVFRHELVHVALQGRDARSPAWLREGIAQYVAQSVAPLTDRRHLAALSLAGVESTSLEPSEKFYTRRPEVNYALAALVCDYVATTQGEDALWRLNERFRTADFTLWRETDAIVRRELGVSTADLSRNALAWARNA